MLLFAVLLVSACGWRLQGSYTFPPQMERVYLQAADSYSPLVRGLRRTLTANGVVVTESPDEATAVLRIIRQQTSQHPLTISSTGRVVEYEVSYSVEYALVSGSTTLLAPQAIEMKRNYSFDESDVLAKTQEGELLVEAMQGDIVRMIARQLAAVQGETGKPADK